MPRRKPLNPDSSSSAVPATQGLQPSPAVLVQEGGASSSTDLPVPPVPWQVRFAAELELHMLQMQMGEVLEISSESSSGEAGDASSGEAGDASSGEADVEVEEAPLGAQATEEPEAARGEADVEVEEAPLGAQAQEEPEAARGEADVEVEEAPLGAQAQEEAEAAETVLYPTDEEADDALDDRLTTWRGFRKRLKSKTSIFEVYND